MMLRFKYVSNMKKLFMKLMKKLMVWLKLFKVKLIVKKNV